MTEANESAGWSRRYNIFFGAVIFVLILINIAIALDLFSISRIWLWIINMVLILLFIVVTGAGITGGLWGFLIDDRLKRVSLSRFQLVLWTIIIVSALLTMVMFNLGNASQAPQDSPVKDDPLNVQVPPEVWGLLGISVVSLASSEYIKDQHTESPQELAAAPRTASSPAPNESTEQASLADMFRGETESSQNFLEIGKVQMFIFTLIVALAYALALGDDLGNTDLTVIERMPELTAGMLTLLGISQAGYIANKAISYQSAPPAGSNT
jgi:hypothetical protein